MHYPDGLLYTKDHEWTKVEENGLATVGITDHAQESLGEIVYTELPEIGKELKSHSTFGVVESIKAVSDLYSPVEGTVTKVNLDLLNSPSTINSSPYQDGWMIEVKLANKESLKTLMNAEQYKKYVDGLK